MNIRPKTVRRLLLLIAVLAFFAGAILILLVASQRRLRVAVAADRVRALAAYNAGDYPTAVSLLGTYLSRSHTENTDRDALFAYAKSRAETPMENGRQTYEAIGLMQHYLDVAPGDAHDARHELLGLYLKARFSKEARELAAALLAKNPGDVQALRTEAQSLINTHDYAGALVACQKLNAVNPTDLLWQEKEILLMNDLKQTGGVVAHASQLLQLHPDDARFQTLMAVAYESVNDDADATKALEAAAKLPPPPDAASVLQMVRICDAQNRFDLSDGLLAQALQKNNDPLLRRLSVQRMFEREQTAQIVEALRNLDPKSPESPTALLGYRALAEYAGHQNDAAAATVGALAGRIDDASAAWTLALRTRYSPAPLDPAAQLKNYTQAVARDPENPIFRVFLADARAAIGDSDAAIREWGIAQKLSPSWALPTYQISREFSSTGRYAPALQAATLLRRRAPNLLAGQVAYAVAWWGLIARSPDVVNGIEGEKLLRLAESIRTRLPADKDILPVYIALLSRRGRHDDAVAALKTAVATDPPLSEALLAQLARVSAEEHLGQSDSILDRAEKAYGLTPAVAFSKAIALYQSGKTEAAKQLVIEFRHRHPDDATWQVAEARFDDLIGDPDASKAWTRACEAHPDVLAVQTAALASPAKLHDRAFWEATIARLKDLTGGEGTVAPVEDARWRLSGQPTPRELDSVAASLEAILLRSPELADAHRLLAETLLRTARPDRIVRSTEELNTAHELQPDDFPTIERLAPLLAQQGQYEKEMALVDAVTRATRVTRDRRLWAAGRYADLGHADAAISLLTDGNSGQTVDPARDGLLATLYRRTGRNADAAALYKRLLADPSAPANVVSDGADFFTQSGDAAEAARFVDRLHQFNFAPGEKELLDARLSEIAGSFDEAARTLTTATQAHPALERVWLELAGLYLRHAKFDEAAHAADSGVAAVPASALLQSMKGAIARLGDIDPADAVSLLDVLSHNPQQPVADATLKVLADARAHRDPPARILSELRALADQNPRFTPLAAIVLNRELAMHQFNDAIEVATRAGAAAPNDPEPQRLLFNAQCAAGNWEAARAAAGRWRQFSGVNPLGVDVAIAQSYLQQPAPDADAAIKQLSPYETDSAPAAQKDGALPLYCRALILAGKSDDAAARLKPMLARSPAWVLVWLELTASHKDVEAARQWLKDAIPSVGTDPQQQIALAAAWSQIGSQFEFIPAYEAARDALQPIIAKPPVSGIAWQLWGIVNQGLGNLQEAQRGRQERLNLEPNSSQAQNDLAYTLLLEGGPDQLAKAEQLCTAAILSDPEVSTYYDTLARIQSQSGKIDDALKSFRLAIAKDPRDVDALVGLADVLQTRPGDRVEAKALLSRINLLVDTGTPLTPDVRKQLDRLKSGLSASS